MKIRVFISSVQKELDDERLSLQILLTTDPFLSQHCVPVLFEKYPAPLVPNQKAYLELLKSCHVYLGMIWKEYGNPAGGLSSTHSEYRSAMVQSMPILIAIKGPNTLVREKETKKLIEEIKKDGHTYDRFTETVELQKKARVRLIRHIKDEYHVEPSADQEDVATQTIYVASAFERQRLDLLEWADMNKQLAAELTAKAEETDISKLNNKDIIISLWRRGYLWQGENERYYGTAAGILLLANDPTVVFTHARIQLSAYSNVQRTHKPLDIDTVRKPLSLAIDAAVAFIKRNTRHPLRVVGLNRVELDEYPEAAVREALVNALAHRDYEDAGRRVTLDIFKDRIEITSPGNLAGGLTLSRLRSGQARSRSRNPNISQGLTLLGRMEERGTGIQRMNAAMLNHGLEKPKLTLVEGELMVTLPGPGDNLDRIKTPTDAPGLISPAVEDKLNQRQKAIMEEVAKSGFVTTAWAVKKFGIVKDTTRRDFNELIEMGLLIRTGKGRRIRYIRQKIDR